MVHTGIQKQWISKAKGWGLIVVADEGIEEGAVVIKDMDAKRCISVQEYLNLTLKQKRGCYQIDRHTFLAPFNFKDPNLELLVNHSCGPNLKHIGNGVWVAIRFLPKGTELTCDYVVFQTNEYGDYESYECHCRSINCRLILSGDDWRREELQDEYRGQFFPSVQRLIDGEM